MSGRERAQPHPRVRVCAASRVARETAAQLATMMEHTVSEGTSWRAFHDGRGGAFLPGVTVAGKTGTLTDAETKRYYTWFTGYAPSHPQPGVRQVAVAADREQPSGQPAVLYVAGEVRVDALESFFVQPEFGRVCLDCQLGHGTSMRQ